MASGSGNVGSWKGDLAGIEGDIIAIEADIVLILAFMVDIDIAITNIEHEVTEIAGHLHTYERWMQPTKQSNPPTHVATNIGTGLGLGDFNIDAGNDDWGTWVQILGSTDTPVIAGSVKFDLHRLVFTTTERNAVYFMQIGFGVSGAQALIDGTYTEIVFVPASNQIDSGPAEILDVQHASGTLAWARCFCPGQNTAQMDFFFGLHEYDE